MKARTNVRSDIAVSDYATLTILSCAVPSGVDKGKGRATEEDLIEEGDGDLPMPDPGDQNEPTGLSLEQDGVDLPLNTPGGASFAEQLKALDADPSVLPFPPFTNEERRGGITALEYSRRGDRIAAGFENSNIIIWNANTRRVVYELRDIEHADYACALAFSPDATRLAAGYRDAVVIIWDLTSGEKLATLTGHGGFVNCVVFSPDGQTLATTGAATVKLWNTTTWEERASTTDHQALILAAVFSPDGSRIVSGAADGVARLWDTRNAKSLHTLRGHDGVIYEVAFSPDGRRLVTSSDDGRAKVWSADSGDEYMFSEHAASVWLAVFSADGRRVLSVSSEGTVKVADSFSADVLGTIAGGSEFRSAPALSADGQYVGVGGEDYSLSIWSTETRKRVAVLRGHLDIVTRICFSPDNERVVSAADDGRVRLWRLCDFPAPPEPEPSEVGSDEVDEPQPEDGSRSTD